MNTAITDNTLFMLTYSININILEIQFKFIDLLITNIYYIFKNLIAKIYRMFWKKFINSLNNY